MTKFALQLATFAPHGVVTLEPVSLAIKDMISATESAPFPPVTKGHLMLDVVSGTGTNRSVLSALKNGSSILRVSACPFLTNVPLTTVLVTALAAMKAITLKMVAVLQLQLRRFLMKDALPGTGKTRCVFSVLKNGPVDPMAYACLFQTNVLLMMNLGLAPPAITATTSN